MRQQQQRGSGTTTTTALSSFGRRKGRTTAIGGAGNNGSAVWRFVQALVVGVVGLLLLSNLWLWRTLKKSSPAAATTANAAGSSSSTSSSADGQLPTFTADASKSAANNCELRRYPPLRYYGLDGAKKNNPQRLEFLTEAEYIYGSWPIRLAGTATSAAAAEIRGDGDGKNRKQPQLAKMCIDQRDWREGDVSASLPFADGTNPSILSASRIKQVLPNDALWTAFPSARYVATACMTDSQCGWNDSEPDRKKFRLSDRTKPDAVLTVLLILDGSFRTLAQAQLLLRRDAPWGQNRRRRIEPHPTEPSRPKLDDARLFVHDNRVWLSYRQGLEFGYDAQVLNPIYWSVDGAGSNRKLSAWLVASETTSFCCGRNMALMEVPENPNKLQSLTWVDPVTVVDVDTTPLLKRPQREQKRRRLLGERHFVHDHSSSEGENLLFEREAAGEHELPMREIIRRKLAATGEKKKKSHIHGTNAFMVYLDKKLTGAPDDVFLGVAHFHRPQDRNANPYARHGHHYTHAFFTITARPPFRLVGLSQEFVLPSLAEDDVEVIQFASGLEMDERDIVIAFGINDCEAAATKFSLSYVQSLLRPVESGKEVVDYMEPLKAPS